MGVDTLLKVLIAVVLVAVVGAGVIALYGGIAPATGAGSAGVSLMSSEDGAHGWGVASVVAAGIDLIYPGTHVDPYEGPGAPTEFGSGGFVTGSGSWLLTALLAIPAALGAFMVAKYLIQLLLGGG